MMPPTTNALCRVFLLLSCCIVSGLATAQRSDQGQLAIGGGADHAMFFLDKRPGTLQPYLSAELASEVLIDRVDLRMRAGTDVSTYGVWAGAGPSVEFDVSSTPVFFEVSLMPGIWMDFDHSFMEGNFSEGLGYPLQFRTQVGIGWHFDDTSGVLLSLSHKSSANIDPTRPNPGIESLQLRWTQTF